MQSWQKLCTKRKNAHKEICLKASRSIWFQTVTNQGKVQFMIYSEAVNADKFIEFLKQLIKSSTRKIYLIPYNLKVHHSKVAKEWVERNKDKIALFFLPS